MKLIDKIGEFIDINNPEDTEEQTKRKMVIMDGLSQLEEFIVDDGKESAEFRNARMLKEMENRRRL